MGSWGVQINENDTACDILIKFKSLTEKDHFPPEVACMKIYLDYCATPEWGHVATVLAYAMLEGQLGVPEWLAVAAIREIRLDLKTLIQDGSDTDGIWKSKESVQERISILTEIKKGLDVFTRNSFGWSIENLDMAY